MRRHATWLFLVAICASGAAQADSSALLFTQKGKLWVRANEKGAEPRPLMNISTKKTHSTELRVNRSGSHGLAKTGDAWWWLDIENKKKVELECLDTPMLSTNGRCVLCRRSKQDYVLYIMGRKRRTLDRRNTGVMAFARAGKGDATITAVAGKLRRRAFAAKKAGKMVTSFAPESLSVAPDGKRGVGVFAKSDTRAGGLYSFRLDPSGAPRRLFRDSVAVAWSTNGEWLLVQADTSACLVRAVGGQYKCWDGFRAASLSGDGQDVYLIGDDEGVSSLFTAPLKGTRSAKPKRLRRRVGSVQWIESALRYDSVKNDK